MFEKDMKEHRIDVKKKVTLSDSGETKASSSSARQKGQSQRLVWNMLNQEFYNNTKADLIRKCAFLPVEVRQELSFNRTLKVPTYKKDHGVVLFVDISGFTALGRQYREQHDKKEATDRLSRDIMGALETLTEICLEWGGDVAKFAGDALICLWKVEEGRVDIDVGLRLARRAAYDMMIATKASDQNLDLHGGIGYGSLLHFYLGKEDMRWYLVSGQACVEAYHRLEGSETGVILHPARENKQIIKDSFDSGDSFSASDFDNGIGEITVKSDPGDKTLFAQDKPKQRLKLTDWADRLSLDDIRPYIPQKVTKKLEGGAIDAGEIHSNVCTMFVSFDYLMLSHAELDSCNVPPETLNALNEVFLTLTKVVRLYNGEVRDLLFDDKGCIFIAVFGAHTSEEMSQLKVVQAGMDISRGFSKCRIGISVGDCFTGMCGTKERHDFIVMGHDVNMAARFMGNAEAGQIIVGPAIMEATRTYLQYEEHRFTRKGVEIECFKLSSQKSKSSVPSLTGAGLDDQEFIGRYRQEAAVDKALDNGNSIVVEGREGVGKSAFLRHLGKRLLIREDKKVIHAEAFALEESSILYVARQIVESILNSVEEANSEIDKKFRTGKSGNRSRIKKDPLLEKLKSLGVPYNAYALKHLLPNVKSMLNGHSKSISMKRRDPNFRKSEVVKKVNNKNGLEKGESEMVFKFMVQLLTKLGDCVIILDDIHYSDIESLELIVSLIKARMRNVTFILSTRPLPKQPSQKRMRYEKLQRIMRQLYRAINVNFVRLHNLNNEECNELVQNFMFFLQNSKGKRYDFDEEVLNVLYTRAKGHPTHLKSLLCWLYEQDLIVLRDGSYVFSNDGAKEMAYSHIPDEVGQSVRARLDDLPGKAQKLLKIAAVIGKTFSLNLLEKLAHIDSAQSNKSHGAEKDSLENREVVNNTLETLQDHGFIEHAMPVDKTNSMTSISVKPRVQFRIARLFGKDDNWKFSVDIVQEVVISCIPQQRLDHLRESIVELRKDENPLFRI